MMNLRTATVDGRLVNIITEEEYASNWRLYNEDPTSCAAIALEVADLSGEKFALPIRGKNDDRPGIYQEGSVYFVRFPKESDECMYKTSEIEIADFREVTAIQDFLLKNQQVRDMETNVLTDIDSVFTPHIGKSDSQEMKAFKQAIIKKHIDLDRYQPRFGSNYLNDKRILKTGNITMNKLISMCEKLDIEAELTLRNAGPNVANPMGSEVTVILTNNGGGDEE